jgi:hypothetical protein
MRALAIGFAFVLGELTAQDTRPLEVLGRRDSPTSMLASHLAATPEEFVVFDIGLFAEVLLTRTLDNAWTGIERRRHRLWLDTLRAMLANARAALPDRARGLAQTGIALLTAEKVDDEAVPDAWRGDLTGVRNTARNKQTWLPDAPEADWANARPNGRYDDYPELRRLWQATIYMRASLPRLEPTERTAWQEAMTAVLAGPRGRQLARIDAIWTAMLGTTSTDPFAIGAMAPGSDRSQVPAGAAPWWERLAIAHRNAPAETKSLHGKLMQFAHELGTEEPTGASANVFAAAAWRHKRLDLADHVHVAVREVDGIRYPLAHSDTKTRPRLLVEPLPRSFAALRAAMQCAVDLAPLVDDENVRIGLDAVDIAELDKVLRLLDHQQAGTDPPADLVDDLWTMLMGRFYGRVVPRSVTRLANVDGNVRRGGPQLVRMPITWQGQSKTALAFRWFVEHETSPGTWEGPRR